ncbi:MAG: glycosyltransferase family 2 protein [Elioraea sp.]|nr:glycosyltransferase family 2 protein [Elioraea sp.]
MAVQTDVVIIARRIKELRLLPLLSEPTRPVPATAEVVLLCLIETDPPPCLGAMLEHHRRSLVRHALLVVSSDVVLDDAIAREPTVSVVRYDAGRLQRRGARPLDALNASARRWLRDRWCLVVAPNEFFVHPFWPKRRVPELVAFLEMERRRHLQAVTVDLIEGEGVEPGGGILQPGQGFDRAGYVQSFWERQGMALVQGGPWLRGPFRHDPARAPVLNRTALFRWRRNLFLRRARADAFAGGILAVWPYRMMNTMHAVEHVSPVGALLRRFGHTVLAGTAPFAPGLTTVPLDDVSALERAGLMTRGQWF